MVTGVLRRQGDSFVVEVSREEVERLHLQEGEVVTLAVHRDGHSGHEGDDHPDADDETAYLLRSPRNRERLLTALAQAERGDGTPMTLAEVRKALGLAEEE